MNKSTGGLQPEIAGGGSIDNHEEAWDYQGETSENKMEKQSPITSNQNFEMLRSLEPNIIKKISFASISKESPKVFDFHLKFQDEKHSTYRNMNLEKY